MVSFARTVKEEIVFNDFDKPCSLALLCGLIKIVGSVELSHGMTLIIRSENAKIIAKAHKILKENYSCETTFLVSRKMKLNKNNVYILKVINAKDIIDDLGLLDGLKSRDIPIETVVNDVNTRRAYLAGVFLGSGSVNNPETSNYHLEMTVTSEDHAYYVASLMNYYDLNAKIITRRHKYIVYLKSSEKIGDFLRAVGASNSVMEFEMTRINRNMSNVVNRWNNCDIANEMKSLKASQSQIEDIAYVIEKAGLEVLDEKTQIVAVIRLENPELTLNELAEVYMVKTGQSISKSGLHHRFKKIKDEAARLRHMEG